MAGYAIYILLLLSVFQIEGNAWYCSRPCMHAIETFVLFFLTVYASCARGFIQLDLLRKRAEKISGGNTLSDNRLDNELRVIPGMSFTCSGTITSLLLGVDVKTFVADSTDQYPEVQVWRYSSLFKSYYRRQRQQIRLAVGNFSTDGVLHYNLNPPMPIESGDVLGVYQPRHNESVVQLFYDDDMTAPAANLRTNTNQGLLSPGHNPTVVENQAILLSPITGMTSTWVLKDVYHVLACRRLSCYTASS